jgi:hypothetical protein
MIYSRAFLLVIGAVIFLFCIVFYTTHRKTPPFLVLNSKMDQTPIDIFYIYSSVPLPCYPSFPRCEVIFYSRLYIACYTSTILVMLIFPAVIFHGEHQPKLFNRRPATSAKNIIPNMKAKTYSSNEFLELFLFSDGIYYTSY